MNFAVVALTVFGCLWRHWCWFSVYIRFHSRLGRNGWRMFYSRVSFLCWVLFRRLCSGNFVFHCIRFRYAKSSTRWKKLIIFSKDMAVVILNHPSLPYHTTFTTDLSVLVFHPQPCHHTLTTLFRTFLLFTFKPPNQHRDKNVRTDSIQLRQKELKIAALTWEILAFEGKIFLADIFCE